MAAGEGGEKTEKATPKKRDDARKKGQVLKSAEINTAVSTLVMYAALMILGGSMVESLSVMLKNTLSDSIAGNTDITLVSAHLSIVGAIMEFAGVIWPLLAVAVVIGIAVNLLQVGFLFVPSSLTPKFSKINPLEGFKRIFSMRSVVELLKAVLKAAIVGVIVYQEYMNRFEEFPNLMFISNIAEVGKLIFDMCVSVAIKASVALIVLGFADYIYQWFDFEKNLKMTKEEIKQEYKTTEGDPMIKSKRREKQRQMSMSRMMQSLPQADVVITNPTHYAMALRYNEKESSAPVVIAKGKDYTAQKIKQKARELGIEIVENKPVAQALYVACEIGDVIPEDMFAAVAEILAFVFKKRNSA